MLGILWMCCGKPLKNEAAIMEWIVIQGFTNNEFVI